MSAICNPRHDFKRARVLIPAPGSSTIELFNVPEDLHFRTLWFIVANALSQAASANGFLEFWGNGGKVLSLPADSSGLANSDSDYVTLGGLINNSNPVRGSLTVTINDDDPGLVASPSVSVIHPMTLHIEFNRLVWTGTTTEAGVSIFAAMHSANTRQF